MLHFDSDQPILGTKESPDLLGRAEYAHEIAKALLLPEDSPSVVVSVEGEWGQGKTSFLNLISAFFESLPNDEQPIVVKFSPWMVSGVGDLVHELLVQLAATINLNDRAEEAKEVASQLLSYSTLFSILKFVPGAEPWASIIKNIFDSVGDATDSISELKKLSLEDRRDKVVEALNKLGKPIVVIIDDIDRLPPKEVFDTVRLVKAVADFPRVSFVMAYDHAYIAKSLEELGINDGAAYLEKIVQSRIHLPLLDFADLADVMDKEMGKLPQEATKDYFSLTDQELSFVYHDSIKYLLKNPRDIKRLVNRLRVTESRCRGEVLFADLLALEVIALKAPKLFEHIRTCPEAYVGESFGQQYQIDSLDDVVESKKGERGQLIEELPEEDQQYWCALIKWLFPLTKGRCQRNHQKAASQGRVSAKDRLQVALSYGLPRNEVSFSLAKQFYSDPDSRDEIYEQIKRSGNLERFLDILNTISQTEDASDEKYCLYLAGIADDQYVVEIDEKHTPSMFGVELIVMIVWLLNIQFEKLQVPQRIDLVKELINDSSALSLGTHGVIKLLKQHGFYGKDKQLPPEDRWCTEAELDEIKNAWQETVKRSLDSGNFCNLNGKGRIFWLLYKLNQQSIAEFTDKMKTTDDGLDCLIKSVSGAGSTNGYAYRYVSQENLELIGNPEEIKSLAQSRIKQSDGLEKSLRAIYQSVIKGKKIYVNDLSEVID